MEKKKPFYGWVILASAVLLMMMGCGAFTGAAAAYMAPTCAQMGFAKGEFTLHRTIASLLGAFLMPVYAKLLRRFGAKKVLLVGVLGNALAYALYSFASSLWHFYLAALLELSLIHISNLPPACSIQTATSSVVRPVLGWMPVGMPRPLSRILALPSAVSVTSICVQKPAMASSIELSTTS